MSSSTFLVARWTGFFDPQSGVREFLWCVGRSPGSCNVTSLTTTLRERAGTATGISLPTGVPLYVTVLVENSAGLKTTGVSDWFVGTCVDT